MKCQSAVNIGYTSVRTSETEHMKCMVIKKGVQPSAYLWSVVRQPKT